MWGSVISPSFDCLDTPLLHEAKKLYHKQSARFGKVFLESFSNLVLIGPVEINRIRIEQSHTAPKRNDVDSQEDV
jgi:hypothetical protein